MANPVRFFISNTAEQQELNRGGHLINPRHLNYACGACGQTTNGRVVAEMKRQGDGKTLLWCFCSCPREEPAIVFEQEGKAVLQIPEAREFKSDDGWPPELGQLFDEGAKAFAAGAYTAAAMVVRKVLMVCACQEGATDGEPFAKYVDHITTNVLSYPKAKDAIDKIRTIGNDANHAVRFVTREDAHRALSIVTYMLNAMYSLPSA